MKLNLCEITEIEEISVKDIDVFDIEVEEDHSYTVEDIVVHNSGCTTKLKTGFGSAGWQIMAVQTCSVSKKDIIADGGIRFNGDIAKSLVFGAKMIMIGSMLSGFDESPGEILEINGKKYKEYYGSASLFCNSKNTHIEGRKIQVEYGGSIIEKYKEIKEDLQSSISYAGGKDLSAFLNTKYIVV